MPVKKEAGEVQPVTLGNYRGIFDNRISVGVKILIGIIALLLIYYWFLR